MMDQLQTFANEVTKVATEVANGELGGQAKNDGSVGIWRSLTDNVNIMALNLTNQVREIADVTRAVARGDLSRKLMFMPRVKSCSCNEQSTRWWTNYELLPLRCLKLLEMSVF